MMTNKERLEKLTQAVALLREVEFSYKVGSETRKMMYRVMVDSFSLTKIGAHMTRLKEEVDIRRLDHKFVERAHIPFKDKDGNWMLWDHEKFAPVKVG